jgi:hypothetical protein
MATNLVSLAMKFLTPDIIMKIGSALGLDKTLAQKAAGAAVPAILAGLVGKVSKPDGAKAVADMVAKQDSNLLGNLASMIGGSGQAAMVSNGTNALTSLLGGSAVSGLTGALAKFAGVSETPTKTLVGMLGPVVLGALGQEQKANKLDTGGLTSLLAGQKSNIAAALPADFSKLLGATGLLESVQGAMKSTSTTPSPATAATPARKVETPTRPGSSTASTAGRAAAAPRSPWWQLPLIASALLGLGWSLFGVNPPKTVTTTAVPTAQRILVDGQDVGGQVTGVIDTLRSTLGGVRDAATAQAALPKLTDAASQLDRVTSLAAKMSPETRKSLAGIVATGNAGLAPLFTTMLGLPGVSAVAKPAVDALRAKLDVLSKT